MSGVLEELEVGSNKWAPCLKGFIVVDATKEATGWETTDGGVKERCVICGWADGRPVTEELFVEVDVNTAGSEKVNLGTITPMSSFSVGTSSKVRDGNCAQPTSK
jgi:hypothetical protein